MEENIFNLDSTNIDNFFSNLELERIKENVINIDDNFSNKEIEDIIVKWLSTGNKENRYADDIPSPESIINWKKLIINNSDIIDFSRSFSWNFPLKNIVFKSWINLPTSQLVTFNCTINGDITFSNLDSWTINLNSTIIKWTISSNSEFSYGQISLWKLSNIHLDKCTINSINIDEFEIPRITIFSTEIEWMTISNTSIRSLFIKDSTIKNIKIISCGLKEIEIINSINHKTNIELNNLEELEKLLIEWKYLDYSKVNKITLNNVYCLEKGLYLFHNLNVIDFFIYEWTNKVPQISFSWVLFNKLILKEIDLNKSTFNFIRINSFYISGVNFSECVFNSVSFPKDNKLLHTFEKNDVTEVLLPQNLKDNYRQLKHVMDKNWNHTEANKFFAKEMYYYWKILSWRNNFFNKLLHTFQWITSDFGNNWLRALICLIGFSVIAIWVDFSYSFNHNRTLPSGYFIQYLNPIFILPTENISYDWKEQLSFIFFKSIYAIILYQLIIAARRTTKR